MSKVSQDRAGKNYQEQLADHLSERPIYDDKAIKDLGMICKKGCTSPQGVLEILEIVELSHDRQDREMRGMPWPGSDDFDRVFYPQNGIELE